MNTIKIIDLLMYTITSWYISDYFPSKVNLTINDYKYSLTHIHSTKILMGHGYISNRVYAMTDPTTLTSCIFKMLQQISTKFTGGTVKVSIYDFE